jgi:hypothetical protein
MLSHYPSNINSKPKTNTKCTTNTIQTPPKKKTKICPVVWKRVVTRRPEGGEKERGRENRPEIHVFQPDLSLYSSNKSGRAWVSAGSVKPTHVHRRSFDSFDRKPSRVLFLPTIQISSTAVFNRLPKRGRRTTESSKREMVFFQSEKEKRCVLKRKKQEKKNVTDGFQRNLL